MCKFRFTLTILSIVSISTLLISCFDQSNFDYRVVNSNSLRGVYGTDAGMHGLWDPVAYNNVHDEFSWEKAFIDDNEIVNYIKNGNFVPIYIYSDGSSAIELRIGTEDERARLTAQEESWCKLKSEKYLYISNGVANISGIEHVNHTPASTVGGVNLKKGRWEVVVNYLEWPSSIYNEKTSYPPEFLVTINPESDRLFKYRSKVNTFDNFP